MSHRKVRVSHPVTGEEIEFSFNVGDTLEEMVEKFGDLVVYKLAYEKAKQSAMNCARNLLSRDKLLRKERSPEEVIRIMEEEWSPVKRLKTALFFNTPTAEDLSEIDKL